jgi:hypothetical protein
LASFRVAIRDVACNSSLGTRRSAEVFNVNPSSSRGGPDQPDVNGFCSMKALLTAFNGSQSVALPPGTSMSDVQFVYQVAQSNESCVANY